MLNAHTEKSFCVFIASLIAIIAITCAIDSNKPPVKHHQRSELNLLIDKLQAQSEHKHVHPKTERERQMIIADIWGIKGTEKETKIFTARK